MAIKNITIRGTASYPHFNSPDTKFNDKGLFHTKLVIGEEAAAGLTKLFEKIRTDEFNRVTKEVLKGKKPGLADLPVKPQLDENDEPTGMFIVSAKMIASGVSKKTSKPWSRTLPIFNAKGSPTNVKVGGGSEVILSVQPEPWYSAKDKEVGVTLRLEGVQIIKLVEFGGKSAAGLGFGAVEGDDIPEGTTDAPEADAADEDGGDYNF
jgi:hypothetical protein